MNGMEPMQITVLSVRERAENWEALVRADCLYAQIHIRLQFSEERADSKRPVRARVR